MGSEGKKKDEESMVPLSCNESLRGMFKFAAEQAAPNDEKKQLDILMAIRDAFKKQTEK